MGTSRRLGNEVKFQAVNKPGTLASIGEIGIIPAVRVTSPADALFASEAIFESGIPVVEITMTTPGAASVISTLVKAHPHAIVGAGTVLDLDIARVGVDAGASFLTSTGLDHELVKFAAEREIAMIPGALTPTEIIMANRAGAAFVKIFPCASLGGPSYIRALRGPFPATRLVAAGGVTQQTAVEYIRAGADVLGIGHDLLPNEAIRTRNLEWILELGRRFTHMVRQAREAKHMNGAQRSKVTSEV